MNVPIDFLIECFQYSPETGLLLWKRRPESHFKSAKYAKAFNSTLAGKQAGSEMNNGYLMVQVRFMGTKGGILVHRIAWAITNKQWPVGMLDHVNRSRKDNRISNLREVSSEENTWNAKRKPGRYPVGVIGPQKKCKKFCARIRVSRKFVILGYFDTAEEAGIAYQKEAILRRGEFHFRQ